MKTICYFTATFSVFFSLRWYKSINTQMTNQWPIKSLLVLPPLYLPTSTLFPLMLWPKLHSNLPSQITLLGEYN